MDLHLYRHELAPFRPGDYVRCLVSTVAVLGGVELRGRIGVVLAADVPPPGDDPGTGWVITVDWRFGAPGLRAPHDAAELGIVRP